MHAVILPVASSWLVGSRPSSLLVLKFTYVPVLVKYTGLIFGFMWKLSNNTHGHCCCRRIETSASMTKHFASLERHHHVCYLHPRSTYISISGGPPTICITHPVLGKRAASSRLCVGVITAKQWQRSSTRFDCLTMRWA